MDYRGVECQSESNFTDGLLKFVSGLDKEFRQKLTKYIQTERYRSSEKYFFELGHRLIRLDQTLHQRNA